MQSGRNMTGPVTSSGDWYGQETVESKKYPAKRIGPFDGEH